MMRIPPRAAVLALLLLTSLPLRADEAEDKAAQAIDKLGGAVARDLEASGKPVIGVDLAGTNATDAALKEMKVFKDLRTVNLSLTDVTDAGLKELKECKKLETLQLAGTSVTDAGLKELSELTSCAFLHLSGTRVTDAGLKELKGLKELRKLYLSEMPITDAGLREIGYLVDLEVLVLGSTKVTGAGVKSAEGVQETSNPGSDLRPNKGRRAQGVARTQGAADIEPDPDAGDGGRSERVQGSPAEMPGHPLRRASKRYNGPIKG